jgi:hypothetical protein
LVILLLASQFFLHAEQLTAKPDLVLHRTIQFSDFHRILSLPFTVPAGTQRISMKFIYSGQEQRTALDLGLLGPSGFRGWSGGDKEGFTLSLSDATPSYLPGLIEPGTWTLLLGVPNIRPNVTSQFTAEVYFDRSTQDEAKDPLLSLHLRPGPAWYRGDLHMHTAHSDGSCKSRMGKKVPCPLFLTVEAAVARGLDFIAVTDHNTQSHYDAERELQPYFDNILLLPGREITTYQGHANLLGTTRFLDFRIGTPEVPDVNSVLRQVAGLDAIVSINHPAAHSGENCMGCGWTPATPVDYRLIQAVEAVNGQHADGERSGVPFWEGLLNRGYHLAGIGGSDNHDAADIPVPGPGSVGYPTTVVQAADLSTPAILAGLRAGHVFIDTEGTRDRLLEYSASVGDRTAAMGDTLQVPENINVMLAVHVMHARGSHLELTADGSKLPVANAAIQDDDLRTTLELSADNRRRWVRLDVCTPDGHRLLIGNPVYLAHPDGLAVNPLHK